MAKLTEVELPDHFLNCAPTSYPVKSNAELSAVPSKVKIV